MEIHPKVLEYLSTINLASMDHRLDFNKDAKVCYWFHTFMYDDLLKQGRDLTGYVFRQRDQQCLMVVKATCDGTQEVVFCTERDPIRCMYVFCRKLYAETLVWRVDKYA